MGEGTASRAFFSRGPTYRRTMKAAINIGRLSRRYRAPLAPHALSNNTVRVGTFSLHINVPHYRHSAPHYSMLRSRAV